MLGVVIWTCKTSGRAIVWCSDNKDLGYYDGHKMLKGPAPILETGDLVEVTIAPKGLLRKCTALRLVEAGYMPEVAETLREKTAIAAA